MENITGSTDLAIWKVALLQHNRQRVKDELRCKNFCNVLFEKLIITPDEHERLQKKENNEGQMAQCDLLLDLCGKKGPEDFRKVLEELQVFHDGLFKVVQQTAKDMKSGKIKLPTERTSYEVLSSTAERTSYEVLSSTADLPSSTYQHSGRTGNGPSVHGYVWSVDSDMCVCPVQEC